MVKTLKTTKITLKTIGGELASTSTLAQKIGPLGLSPKKIGEDIAKKTIKLWKGILITINLIIRKRKVFIKIDHTTSSLIRRELKKNANTNSNNITAKQLKKICKKIKSKSYAKTFSGVCLEVLGTCNSLKITVDKMRPKLFQKKIKEGEIVLDTSF